MTRETHPKVFEVKDKADSTVYEVDQEYVNYLEKFFESGLLDEGTGDALVAKQDMIRNSIANLRSLEDGSFQSAHNFVHNGRLMNTSTDVSHQSSKNVLAAYTFKQQEPQGQLGWEWMQVLTQDTYGYSGTGDTRVDRVAAAEKNQEKWMEVAADPLAHMDYIMEADVPMLFLRHILEMKRALETEGGPQNYKSGLPAHMDATTSGIQFLAGITKDGNAARIANLTNTNERFDSYSNVVVQFLEELEKAGPMPENHEAIRAEFHERQQAVADLAAEAAAVDSKDKEVRTAAWEKWRTAQEEFKAWKGESKDVNSNVSVAARSFWFQEGIKKKFRKIFKKPVMTKYYSAKQGGMADSLLASFQDDPKFKGINKSFTSWLAGRVTKAADKVFDGPGRVMRIMQLVAKDVAAADQKVTFTNPVSGFKIVNDPRVERSETVRFNYHGTNEDIKKRNTTGRIETKIAFDSEEKNLNKQKAQIAPLVVHSLDAALVHYVFLHADFPVQTIHDSFATTPAHTQELYHLIRQGFHEITKGDTLLTIIEEIYENAGFENYKALAKEKFQETQIGDWDPKGILDNQYGFSAGVTDPDVADKTIAKMRAGQQPAFSLSESFESDQINESVTHELRKIAEESKPCK